MLTSASGRAYLAHCQEQQRTSLLDAVAASGAPEARLARNSVELARVFTEVRTQGYASAATSRRSSDDMTIAVAVNHGELVFAALSIRVAAIAMPLKTAVERFLGPLRACASTIGSRLAEREPVTPACGTPVIPAE